jgi:DNA repair exonuclease SbcCD ATPase subunit
MNLLLDHKDTKGSAVGHWIGFVRNVNLAGDSLKGDLEIWHPLISLFIKQAKAKFGVSATMIGSEHINSQTGNYDYQINSFKSMSIVDEPGCGTSWLPKMLAKVEKGEKRVIGGLVEEGQIKSLTNTEESETIDESANQDTEENSDHISHNCKEVGKMTEENQTQKSTEEKTEKTEKSLSDSKESYSKDVKNLNAKIDKLTEVVMGLSETVKNLSAEKESSEEESKEEETKAEETKTEETSEEKTEEKSEEKPEEEPKEEPSKELEETKKELDETKKELAALKEEVNSPDRKTLAGTNTGESNTDANAGMLGFLRETANIPIY